MAGIHSPVLLLFPSTFDTIVPGLCGDVASNPPPFRHTWHWPEMAGNVDENTTSPFHTDVLRGEVRSSARDKDERPVTVEPNPWQRGRMPGWKPDP
eukprot:scaffold2639_cov361-Pavlova_lutheri.AAC.41